MKAPITPIVTTPDDPTLIGLVHLLHLVSEDAGTHRETFVRDRLRDAAVALDEFRAGHRLVKPAEGSGYALVRLPEVPTSASAIPIPLDDTPTVAAQAPSPRPHAEQVMLETGTSVRFLQPQGGVGANMWRMMSGTIAACSEIPGEEVTYTIHAGNRLYEVMPGQIVLVGDTKKEAA